MEEPPGNLELKDLDWSKKNKNKLLQPHIIILTEHMVMLTHTKKKLIRDLSKQVFHYKL